MVDNLRDIENFICDENDNMKSVLAKLEVSRKGALVVLSDKSVIGIITDGDVRRFLLSHSLAEEINAGRLCNREFVYAKHSDPYENIVSKLSEKIKLLPIVADDGALLRIEFRDEVHLSSRKEIVHARAPARITFGGGGSDKLNFFKHSRGLCINAAVKKYAFCTISKPDSGCFVQIVSTDYRCEWKFDSLDELTATSDPRLLIYKTVLSFLNYRKPVKIITHCDFPIGSGLGGSSSLTVAMLHAFNDIKGHAVSKIRLAQDAYKLERVAMQIKGGWQDQYVAAVGGINALYFAKERHDVHNLKLDSRILLELEASLYLCFTGLVHDSSKIHSGIDLSEHDRAQKMQETVRLASEMVSALTNSDLDNFDDNMNENWELKKQYSEQISSADLDDQILGLRKAGATSVKILGAGGGGYFLARVPAQNNNEFKLFCSENAILPERVTFDYDGVVSWT